MRRAPIRFTVLLVAAAAFLIAGCNPPPDPLPPPPTPPTLPSVPAVPAEPGAPSGQEAAPGGPELDHWTGLDLCAEVLTSAQVEQVVGQPVERESPRGDACSYTGTDPHAGPWVILTASRPWEGTPESWVAATEAVARSTARATTRRVEGLGDAAVLVTFPGRSIVYVKTGDTVLALAVSLTGSGPVGDPALTDEATLELARIALQRLP